MEKLNVPGVDFDTVEIQGQHTNIIFDTVTFEQGEQEQTVTFEDKFNGVFYLKGGEIADFIHNFKTFIQAYEDNNNQKEKK